MLSATSGAAAAWNTRVERKEDDDALSSHGNRLAGDIRRCVRRQGSKGPERAHSLRARLHDGSGVRIVQRLLPAVFLRERRLATLRRSVCVAAARFDHTDADADDISYGGAYDRSDDLADHDAHDVADEYSSDRFTDLHVDDGLHRRANRR